MRVVSSSKVEFACSGREVYVNRGIIGIDDEGKLFEGYDGNFDYECFCPRGEVSEECSSLHMTEAERNELADYMIARWLRWRSRSS